MYTITRNHKGISCNAVAGNMLPKDVYETFNYAIGSYGQILNIDETLNGSQWIDRIKGYYNANNPRTIKVIESIELAMPSIPSYVNHTV